MSDTSTQDFNALFALVATPIIVVDLERGQILSMNSRAEEITGYSKDTVNQVPILKLFSAKSQNQVKALFDLARSQKANIEFKEEHLGLRRRAGRVCSVSLTATQTHWRGLAVLILTLADLTDSENQAKEHMALIEESARVSKLADIGRLAGGIAHELNNPLAILLGYAENLDYLLAENKFTKEDIRLNLEPIQSAAGRMAKIIEKMMAMIRHESTELKTLSLAKIVRECLILLEDVIKSYSISLESRVTDSLLKCDSTHIEQVITNIITNACNALQDLKEDRKIAIRSKEENGRVILEIWNNGSPIQKETQKKIFTPFFTTKDVGEGTGLGLYLCYNIMKAHSGELTFRSTHEEGTSFFMSFPLVHQMDATPPKTPILRALIVDDDTFFRRMICQKLKLFEIEVHEARNGQEALQIQNETNLKFDLFFVDAKMPKMSGPEYIETIKKIDPDVFTVMISGYPKDSEIVNAIHNLKVDQFLSKPIQNSEFAQIIQFAKDRASLKSRKVA